MSRRWLVVAALGIVSTVTGPSVRAQGPGPQVITARVTFAQPTYVGGRVLVGEYVIVHDEHKMNAGEPCTTIYRPTGDRAQKIVSFHCVPRPRAAVDHVVVRLTPEERMPGTWIRRLVEYQFAGEAEGHGVPF